MYYMLGAASHPGSLKGRVIKSMIKTMIKIMMLIIYNYVNDQEVATCGPGEAFGERSLTSDQLVRTWQKLLAMYAC